VAIAICGLVSDGLRFEARAQVDPYTGGIVSPVEPCTPGTIAVTPSGILTPGQEFTLSTAGQRPGSSANFYVAGELVGSVVTDATGAASVPTRAPQGFTGNFVVAVSGPCGTATAIVDPQARAAELGRGLARTGFALWAWVAAALALILIGRKLAASRHGARRAW
jgi:hypothetical protein